MGELITTGIIGASGYGGVQLVRLLQSHPQLDLTYLGANRNANKWLGEVYPHLEHWTPLKLEPIDLDGIARRCEVVFLSLPHGIAQTMVPSLLSRGCRIFDLSADYRFSNLEIYR
jgi:N-acetyl-gamma-glutamyl-phosphate reductase